MLINSPSFEKAKVPRCPCQDGRPEKPFSVRRPQDRQRIFFKLVIHGGDIASRLVEHDINTLVLAVNDFFTAYRDNVAFGTNLVADMSRWPLTFTLPRSINSSALRREQNPHSDRYFWKSYGFVFILFSLYFEIVFCSHDVSSAV